MNYFYVVPPGGPSVFYFHLRYSKFKNEGENIPSEAEGLLLSMPYFHNVAILNHILFPFYS